jgi:integrase
MSAPETPDPDNPLEWIIESHYSKKAPGTEDVARLSLLGTIGPNGDGADVALGPWLDEQGVPPEQLTVDLAYEYLSEVQQAYKPQTQHNRANYASKSYDLLLRRNVEGFEYNPIAKVLEDYPNLLDDITQRSARIYEKDELKEVMQDQHPANMCCSMTMLKTARRIGGVLNLDFYDVHIDHPAADWAVHQEIRDKPDHIHFGPGASQGETHRGEVRQDGQKTKTHVAVPMDQELKDFLVWYMLFRRSSEQEGAFFINPRGVEHGQRLSSSAYRDHLRPIVKEKGYYYGDRDPDNIRPHYWRHWTTTKMRDRIDDGVVDYFRGDKKVTSDTYNHHTEEKARMWRQNIPKFYSPYTDK